MPAREAVCASVTKTKQKKRRRNHYPEGEANRLFGYTAKQTLDNTKKKTNTQETILKKKTILYEKKLLTYPRTDSRF